MRKYTEFWIYTQFPKNPFFVLNRIHHQNQSSLFTLLFYKLFLRSRLEHALSLRQKGTLFDDMFMLLPQCVCTLTVCVCACLVASVLSDSLQRYGLQSTRRIYPLDSSGKNIGVDCHALLQGTFQTQGLNLHPGNLPNPGIEPASHSYICCNGRQVLYCQCHIGSPTHCLQPSNYLPYVIFCTYRNSNPTTFSGTLLLLLFTVRSFYICPEPKNYFGKELGEGLPLPAFHKS